MPLADWVSSLPCCVMVLDQKVAMEILCNFCLSHCEWSRAFIDLLICSLITMVTVSLRNCYVEVIKVMAFGDIGELNRLLVAAVAKNPSMRRLQVLS